MESLKKKKKKSREVFLCAIPASVEAKGNGRRSWKRMKRCGHEHANILEQSLVRHCRTKNKAKRAQPSQKVESPPVKMSMKL